jgi:hypothetical protein
MSMPDLMQFSDPPALYRTAPLLVWNDEMTVEQIIHQLNELKTHGFGGGFVHPRPGMITTYLSDEWFELWSVALKEAERLGLKLYIYDENSYPSGFAGGHVSSQLPDCLANSVIMRELDPSNWTSAFPALSGMLNRPGHPIRVFAYKGSSAQGEPYEITHDVTSVPPAEWQQYGERFLWFELGKPEANSWLGGFAYTDLLRPEVAQVFLDSTYEAYRSRYGDKFGDAIPAIFTDEPEISPGNLFQSGSNFLPFSYWFSGQFEERNGYDIKDHLPCLFKNVTGPSLIHDAQKVRYDYYDTIRELWVNNFIRPISEWCERHGIAWTGHYLEHNWPYPWGRSSPTVMSLYEYMQWPGIDMLRSNLLRQEGQKPGVEPLTLTIREAHSVANQFNRERVLCEAYGAGGWDSDFRDYKRIGDWLVVHGINFINQHLTFSTIVGARKRDHPQSFDWRQPWWEEYAKLNEYFGRVTYMLSQGQTHNRILLLNPVSGVFMETPESQRGGLRVQSQPPRNPDMSFYLKAVQELCDRQWNYDFGDEFIMERHGSVAGQAVHIANRTYDIVVFPDSMTNLKASTFRLLETFLQAGGTVIAMGKPPGRIDGAASDEAQRLASYPSWRQASSIEAIEQVLRERLSVDYEWQEETPLPTGVHHLRRHYEDGSSAYFIVNSSPQELRSSLKLRGAHVELWDAWSGETKPLPYKLDGDFVKVNVVLPEEGSLLLLVRGAEAAASTDTHALSARLTNADHVGTAVQLLSAPTTVRPERDNVLVLDYCDIRVGSKSYDNMSTVHGQRLIFEHHGFETNPWDNGVQFKSRLLDRNQFGERSGFEATYRFHVNGSGMNGPIQLMAERGRSYQLLVNGIPTHWTQSKQAWDLDHHFDAADITAAIVEGVNTVTLQTSPFDIRLELEAVFILGTFAVDNVQGKWTISRQAQELGIGSWKEQGYPFYSHGVCYEKHVRIKDLAKSYSICLPEWSGAVASLTVNGLHAGLFGAGQGDRHDIAPYLQKGDNVITVRVCGNFKNLLGPHHEPDKVTKSAWPRNFKKSPLYGPPAAELYDLADFGLLRDFTVEVHDLDK